MKTDGTNIHNCVLQVIEKMISKNNICVGREGLRRERAFCSMLLSQFPL